MTNATARGWIPVWVWVAGLWGCGSSLVDEACTNAVDDDANDRVDCDDPACARHCDTDDDGFRDVAFPQGVDCDDANPQVFPEAPEVCNGLDDNCDGLVDDADPKVLDAGRRNLHVDADGDGVGGDTIIRRCGPGPGASELRGDCDDADPARARTFAEVCDGIDNDCDDLVDEADPSLVDLPTLFQDRDHDGHGDPAIAIAACPVDGWVSDALDCDDTRIDVFAGAAEVCDGVDTDCDGVMGADEVDNDGDGDPVCTDCDDGDPLRSSRAIERCGPIDDDCDGLVDEADPSLNPYTCGYCPIADPNLIDPAVIYNETWNPCVLDPAAEAMCSTDPYHPDTNTSGERLHRVAYRTDEGYWRDELFLFIPPGPGRENNTIRTWAAYAGYRTVSIGYANDDESSCTASNSDDCFRAVRYETTYGTDLSALVDMVPADSIEHRLSVLLETLAIEHPDVGFDQYLRADGTPEWSKILVTGWSGGGGYAAFIPHYERVAGVILMSAPADYGAVREAPADWVLAPSETPGCAEFATWHVTEPGGHPGEVFERSFDAMGIPPGNWDLDEHFLQTPPPGTFRITQSVDPDTLDETCSAHGSVARDTCMRDGQLPAYLYLFCAASDVDPDVCEGPVVE